MREDEYRKPLTTNSLAIGSSIMWYSPPPPNIEIHFQQAAMLKAK